MTITRSSDDRILYVNDAFVSMLGYSRSEVVGRTASDLNLYADPADRERLKQLLAEHRLRDVPFKTRTKSGAILDLVLSGERIELLGEESWLQIAVDDTDRRRFEEQLRRSERLLRLVLDVLPVGVAVQDPGGDLVLSNPAALRIWSSLIRPGPERYTRSKAWWHDSGRRIEPEEWASVRARLEGETSINEVIDIEAFDGSRKILQNSAIPIRDEHQAIVGAVVINEDITARKMAERDLEASVKEMQRLATRLMHAQDDERRRIARMLHETTAQDLAALKMLLARVSRSSGQLSEADRDLLHESMVLADRSMSTVRTLSYLLHPPFLDEAGLLSAVRWYAQGFAERSGIKVDLDLPETFARLPQDVETTLFRIVQEALINVHRHAASPVAQIRLWTNDEFMTLEIRDCGRGMPAELVSRLTTGGGALGVGIAGMRERLNQLGGTLDIESSDRGTVLRATIPRPSLT
jgi:PAS domain S-box-containing protein